MLDVESFATLLTQNYERCWLVAAAVTGDRIEADDIVQEAAIIALTKLADFTEGSNFTAWMSQIVRLTALNYAKKSNRRSAVATDPAMIDRTANSAGPRTNDALVSTADGRLAENQSDFDDEVLSALRELSEEARACLLLRIVQRLSYSEIAKTLQIPEGTAMSHVHRAKQSLGQRLKTGSEPQGAARKGKPEREICKTGAEMTGSQPQPDDLKLQAYLDGQLPEQDRAEVARAIAANEELQKEVELQSRIDDALRRRFEVPAGVKVALPTEVIIQSRARKFRRRAIIVGLATAATVAWAILGWQFFSQRDEVPTYDPNQPLAEIYNKQVAAGFKPIWVCEDDKEFASTFQKRQGQALLLAAMPPGTKMEGLTYCGGISRYTTTMLARVDGKPVMVFVDRANADSHPTPPAANTGRHLFRKELGPLVLYELTPFDRPTVMDYLKLAEVPPAE